ncbi:MAG: hypothetical protein AB7Y46_04140 [Armatimonadota bacterium]
MGDPSIRTEHEVREFARATGVREGIVVGRGQHHRVIKPSDMNALRGQYRWAD